MDEWFSALHLTLHNRLRYTTFDMIARRSRLCRRRLETRYTAVGQYSEGRTIEYDHCIKVI